MMLNAATAKIYLGLDPTDMRKSFDTLAALVRQINQTSSRHIITVEDPIEYVHEPIQSRITQRQVGKHVESFSAALRSALREAPDVLVIGEMRDSETCCGFGGLFAVKYGEISDAIVSQKTKAIDETGADLLLAGDLGCLMNMAGKLHRDGSRVRVYHAAEVLAGMADAPSVGEKG